MPGISYFGISVDFRTFSITDTGTNASLRYVSCNQPLTDEDYGTFGTIFVTTKQPQLDNQMKKIMLIAFLAMTSFYEAQVWLWGKSGKGINPDAAYGVSTDPSGNVFIGGNFTSGVMSFGSYTLPVWPAGYNSAFIVKYSPNGNVLWAKSPTGGGGANSVYTDQNGNTILIGSFGSPTMIFGSYTLTNSGNADVFIAKYDPNGNVMWAKNLIGSGDEHIVSVKTDNIGNVFVTGDFNSPTLSLGSLTLTNSGAEDIFILKLDVNGNPLWTKNNNGSGSDYSNHISVDVHGNSYITGSFYSPTISFSSFTFTNASSGTNDLFITKYDPNGNVLWSKSYGGVWTDVANSSLVDADGNLYFTGSFASPTITIGTSTFSLSGIGANMFLAKFDQNFNTLWVQRSIGAGGRGYSLASHGKGVFLLGYASGSMTINNYTLAPPSSSCDMTSLFLAKYDNNGNVLYAHMLDHGVGSNNGSGAQNSLCSDNSCNLYIGNSFSCGPFIIANDTLTVNISGSPQDPFVAKFQYCSTVDLSEFQENLEINIYPNPSSKFVNIDIGNFTSVCELDIYNSYGQKITSYNIVNEKTIVNTEQFASGFYFYYLTRKGQVLKNGKILIE